MTTAPGLNAATPHQNPLWIRELPFGLVLIATVAGVAYTSLSNKPIVLYWEALAPAIWLVCIVSGWPGAQDRAARIRLIATQTAHWVAFLVVMNLLLLPTVQKLFNANATGVAVFTLLTLGTFTAGVHALSWQVGLLGLVMAFGIPAIAWFENTALTALVVIAAAMSIAVVVWRHWPRKQSQNGKPNVPGGRQAAT
jgi:hypothetical protein